MGIVDEVVSTADLRDRASQIAGKWSKVSPITYRLTKQQLSSDLEAQMERHSTALGEAVVETWGSEDTRTVIGRFVSRTLSQPKS